MKLQAIGIDLGKTVFHLVGLDSSGNVIVRKRCSRTQLLKYTANLRVQRIGMEACSGSHFLARALPRTRPYSAQRPESRRSGPSGDPNRSRAETGGFISHAVGSAAARTGAALGTHRTDGR